MGEGEGEYALISCIINNHRLWCNCYTRELAETHKPSVDMLC
jgi:hypothetical protein